MHNRLLPSPFTSLVLFTVWLLLNQSLAPIHLFFAVILAVVLPLITTKFRDKQPRIKKPLLVARYMLRVLGDIVAANLEVAVIILGPRHKLKPAFVRVPIDIHHSLPLTILANTVSMTPGTVSADIYPHDDSIDSSQPLPQRWLLIHVLNLSDEAKLIESIKQRYEAPLKEIFQC
ncbi:Na+/H+ antiporter subunit E [Rheinheimera sp. WS51]|uniref:Na+/H+ antiporter subunit E n=1 Tax=Rheinheimera sp. WS51 TaxID=3425886 RepID=UPI003D8DE3E2